MVKTCFRDWCRDIWSIIFIMVINYGYYTFESYCNFVFCHFPFRVGILFFSTHHLGLTLMRATAFYPYEGLVAATIWTLRCRPWRGISYGLCHYLGVLISIRYSTLFCSISDWKSCFSIKKIDFERSTHSLVKIHNTKDYSFTLLTKKKVSSNWTNGMIKKS